MLFDEWQEVPHILNYLKKAVDNSAVPGSYIVTGSVGAELNRHVWPGTGRLIHIPFFPLTIKELTGNTQEIDFISAVKQGDIEHLKPNGPRLGLYDYLELATTGGFPDAIHIGAGKLRKAWFSSYLNNLVNHDIASLKERIDRRKFEAFLHSIALNSAGIPTNQTLAESARLNRKTADAYISLLHDTYMLDSVPSWSHNRLSRLSKNYKRYLIDSSLISGALQLDSKTIIADGNLLGRVIDTFVAAQIRPLLPVMEEAPALFHLRQQDGRREIDLILEFTQGNIIAVEIKAGPSPSVDDARHLDWLHNSIGDKFIHGIVFHTGPNIYRLREKIHAVPISMLWDYSTISRDGLL